MSELESPGAVAALGASEDDQLRGTVEPEDSLRNLIAQHLLLRAGIPKRISTSPKNHAGTIAAVFPRVLLAASQKTGKPHHG